MRYYLILALAMIGCGREELPELCPITGYYLVQPENSVIIDETIYIPCEASKQQKENAK
jgi:hypothetical protein